MDSFLFYLKEGFLHITDLNGVDHILFIASVCLSFQINDFRKIIYAVTFFTAGHSVSLALSISNQLLLPSNVIEWLIPTTILISVGMNFKKGSQNKNVFLRKNMLIGLFGIIHGMGFSNYLKNMMGTEENILLPLLAFNTGLEIGQLMIVAFILLLNFTANRVLKISQPAWIHFGNGFIFGLATLLCTERWPF